MVSITLVTGTYCRRDIRTHIRPAHGGGQCDLVAGGETAELSSPVLPGGAVLGRDAHVVFPRQKVRGWDRPPLQGRGEHSPPASVDARRGAGREARMESTCHHVPILGWDGGWGDRRPMGVWGQSLQAPYSCKGVTFFAML